MISKWRDVYRIKKNKLARYRGVTTINLPHLTNGIKWNNTSCIAGNNNLSTLNGGVKFETSVKKIDDNNFEVGSIYYKTQYQDSGDYLFYFFERGETKLHTVFFPKVNIYDGYLIIQYPRSFTKWHDLRVARFARPYRIYLNNDLLYELKIDSIQKGNYIDGKYEIDKINYSERWSYNPSIKKMIFKDPDMVMELTDNIDSIEVSMSFHQDEKLREYWFYQMDTKMYARYFGNEYIGLEINQNEGIAMFTEIDTGGE